MSRTTKPNRSERNAGPGTFCASIGPLRTLHALHRTLWLAIWVSASVRGASWTHDAEGHLGHAGKKVPRVADVETAKDNEVSHCADQAVQEDLDERGVVAHRPQDQPPNGAGCQDLDEPARGQRQGKELSTGQKATD